MITCVNHEGHKAHGEVFSKYNSLDAVPQQAFVEVDNQAHAKPGQSQIRQHLCCEDIFEPEHTLDFHDNSVLDDEVRYVVADLHATVLQVNGSLAFEGNTAVRELYAQRSVIRALKEAGTKVAMYLDGAANDLLADDGVVIHAYLGACGVPSGTWHVLANRSKSVANSAINSTKVC